MSTGVVLSHLLQRRHQSKFCGQRAPQTGVVHVAGDDHTQHPLRNICTSISQVEGARVNGCRALTSTSTPSSGQPLSGCFPPDSCSACSWTTPTAATSQRHTDTNISSERERVSTGAVLSQCRHPRHQTQLSRQASHEIVEAHVAASPPQPPPLSDTWTRISQMRGNACQRVRCSHK